MSTADQRQPPALPTRWSWKETVGGFVALSDDGVAVGYSIFTGNILTTIGNEDTGHAIGRGRTVTGFMVPLAVYTAVAAYAAAGPGDPG